MAVAVAVTAELVMVTFWEVETTGSVKVVWWAVVDITGVVSTEVVGSVIDCVEVTAVPG